jgi:hypothetical protein
MRTIDGINLAVSHKKFMTARRSLIREPLLLKFYTKKVRSRQNVSPVLLPFSFVFDVWKLKQRKPNDNKRFESFERSN